MSDYFRGIPLVEGETVLLRQTANLYASWRSIGGRIAITTKALLFDPNQLDRFLFARSQRIFLTDIADVGIVGPDTVTWNPHHARKRVRVQIAGGRSLIFAVKNPHLLVQSLATFGSSPQVCWISVFGLARRRASDLGPRSR